MDESNLHACSRSAWRSSPLVHGSSLRLRCLRHFSRAARRSLKTPYFAKHISLGINARVHRFSVAKRFFTTDPKYLAGITRYCTTVIAYDVPESRAAHGRATMRPPSLRIMAA